MSDFRNGCTALVLSTLVVEQMSTDIEWLVEIHCSSDDRSGSSADRFIIITEDFIIFSYVYTYPRFFTNF